MGADRDAPTDESEPILIEAASIAQAATSSPCAAALTVIMMPLSGTKFALTE